MTHPKLINAKVLHALLFTSLLFSCQEEIKINDSISEYSKLNEGNYWVYEETHFDLNDNVVSRYLDTVRVVATITLNSHSYLQVNQRSISTRKLVTRLLRDSLNYLVDQDGTKLLVNMPVANLEQFSNALYTIKSFVISEEKLNLSPTLSFNSILNRREEINILSTSHATFFNDNQYAKGVGLVRQSVLLWPSKERFERVLIAWKVN